MRRRGSTDSIVDVIGRALRREKDGVLEAPSGSGLIVFLDDVHILDEVKKCRVATVANELLSLP